MSKEQQGQEAQKSALELFGIDLTAIARSGKLDPVIGRDAEIRRVSQVLSRRTKNNPELILSSYDDIDFSFARRTLRIWPALPWLTCRRASH